MYYYTTLLLFFGLLFAIFVFISFLLSFKKKYFLKKLSRTPFKEEYRKYLKKTNHYNHLSVEDKKKIEQSIIVFINTKEFIGISIEITDEMKVIIAFYACLLLLHKTDLNCYDNLKTIIIYPNAVALENIQISNGIYTKEKFLIDGQATKDTVVIIWHDAKKQAYHLRHNNVIIHEFAHEIDFMDGEIDGVVPIERSKYDQWTHILFTDYKKLNEVVVKNRDFGKYKLLGRYAATNEAEFS
jgi:Mlc titration factor MtfA (ptsG expression regulator)